ncbi:ATP-binding protein [Anaerosacchariphilus polymeriproducens]|uniref:DNA replication protein DnaC n=1 Tax=Anaerosacchariphilus polymeriproducens TaxID=1812858 RepID=A0A371AZY6_9FIRM|nr:ATP-binding protein [Anaerosacchariphilus polymeriproducens]RDU25103.1 DNA replication protein DnaC [Anaerosacchariphilus polymeriproducens]
MSLKNTQYDALIRVYNQRQLASQHLLDSHRKELYSKSARFAELDEIIASYSVQQAKKLLDGDSNAVERLKLKLQECMEEKAALIAMLGYPRDYLELQYYCKDCKDTGYIGNQKCHCFKQAAINLLYTQSNIQEIIEVENFEHFSYKYYSDSNINPTTGLSSLETMKRAVNECWNFINQFDQKFENLFFYGDTGIGKTFLSNCIAKELLNRSKSVIYFSAFQLFDIFAKNTFEKNTEFQEMNQHIFNCDLLIIDDLGTELTNSFISAQLFLCVNERILRKKSTIISTNLAINTLVDNYSERTFSRISSNYTMLKLFGDDIRIKKKLGI